MTNSTDKTHGPTQRPKDNRDIVTRFAFEVDQQLLGKSIARPWRRGIAQCIDFVLIAILSQLPSIILAILTSFAFLRASRRNNPNISSSKAKGWLRFTGTGLLFLATLIVVEALRTEPEPVESEGTVAQAIVYGLNLVAWEKCQAGTDCRLKLAANVGESLAESQADRDTVEEHLTNFLDARDLSAEQEEQLLAAYLSAFDQSLTKLAATTEPPNGLSTDQTENTSTSQSPPDAAEKSYRPLAWAEGFAGDLGLGFGWAALYHSVFIAWFRGRTPGKKLIKIRAVKLDGSAFSLWDSFGRYGGYGAGFATGLLGFIQIYWDANRQAIQDKIAETVVIKEP